MAQTSHLGSNVKPCDIYIHQIPARPINVAKAVRVGNTTVFTDVNGKIYSTGIQIGFSFSPVWSARDKFANVYQGLVKLGVISAADAAEHLRQANELAARENRKYEVEAIKKNAASLGLKLTPTQLKQLDIL